MTNDFKKIHKFLLDNSSDLPKLKKIILNNGVLNIPSPKYSFKEITFQTIISQQISNKVAEKIWNKVHCFLRKDSKNFNIKPNNFNYKKLRFLGVSKKKLNCMALFLEKYPDMKSIPKNLNYSSLKDFKDELKSIKGIGEWTCDMILIFYFQEINIWPKTDFIIKKYSNYIVENNNNNKTSCIKSFSPYLSILALHIWKYSDQN